MSIQRFESGKRLSEVLVHDGRAFISGQIPDDTSVDIQGQTRQVLDSIDRLLKLAGTDKSKILFANIWLRHGDDFAAMNEIWEAWITPGCAPARATVGSPLVGPDSLRIEIALQAAV
ncbi:MAG: RidA family protein [Burkholderiaceae bacterium]